MADRDHRDDRTKKTWREIDAKREGSSSRTSTSGMPPRPQREEDRASKQHRAALEAMFAKGGLGKLVDQMSSKSSAKTSTPAPAPVEAAPAAPRAPVPPGPPTEDQTRASLRKKILEAIGRDQITRAVDKYCETNALPSDYEVLEQTLDHIRQERISESLSLLERMLDKDKPKRSRALVGKLRFLEETSHDTELKASAARIRAKLG